MTEPVYSDSELDHYRRVFRDGADGKTTTHVPVRNGQAGKVADMLDHLKELTSPTEYRPCRACGERGHTQGGYCADHS